MYSKYEYSTINTSEYRIYGYGGIFVMNRQRNKFLGTLFVQKHSRR